MSIETQKELKQRPWWAGITGYQWLVLTVAWLGWVFDSMDSTLYAMVLQPALNELLGHSSSTEGIEWYGGIIFSIFLMGWALGGMVFGIMADYIGRTKTMILTILIYSLFTGMAALSRRGGIWPFTGSSLPWELAGSGRRVPRWWLKPGRRRRGPKLQEFFSLPGRPGFS